MRRLLVIGAGASFAECAESGNKKDDRSRYLPLISDFGKKLFLPSPIPMITRNADNITMSASNMPALDNVIISYLENSGVSIDSESTRPVDIFHELEKSSPKEHNVEKLFEHAWQLYKDKPQLWEKLIQDSIHLHLWALYTDQFGFNEAVPMVAGRQVAERLKNGDTVINLNYDIAFDHALIQAKKQFVYNQLGTHLINVLKPHGSLNLYVDAPDGNIYSPDSSFIFVPANEIRSTGNETIDGKVCSPYAGILPPRINKNYSQHPIAKFILNAGEPYTHKIITFWGIGMTDSDNDLLRIYRKLSKHAKIIEFINPCTEALQKARKELKRGIKHYRTHAEWLAQH